MKDYLTCGPHYTYGYLRRTELDDPEMGFCYEAPDGALIFSCQPEHEEIMMLFEIIDKNGERCLCDRKGILLP